MVEDETKDNENIASLKEEQLQLLKVLHLPFSFYLSLSLSRPSFVFLIWCGIGFVWCTEIEIFAYLVPIL